MPALKITDIFLDDFRSYEHFELHDVSDLTILSGPNASGKTNAIEALQLLTAQTSFRNSKSADLIRRGEKAAKAKICMSDGPRRIDMAIVLSATGEQPADPSEQEFQGGAGRQYIYNSKKRPAKELRGILPSVIFTPDDLNLAKGSNRYRRHELDVLGGQVNANYYQIVRDYDKVLRQKNRLLKDEAPMSLLEAADEVFQTVARQLTNYRRSLFERLSTKIAEFYDALGSNGEHLTSEYIESRPRQSTESVTLKEEAMNKRTLAGPHLHAINFYIDALPVQDFASQGQGRSLVLAIKLAESELISEILDQKPVLLFDDVMSELDSGRRKALVKELLEDKQTFITTANIDYFDKEMLEKAKIVSF